MLRIILIAIVPVLLGTKTFSQELNLEKPKSASQVNREAAEIRRYLTVFEDRDLMRALELTIEQKMKLAEFTMQLYDIDSSYQMRQSLLHFSEHARNSNLNPNIDGLYDKFVSIRKAISRDVFLPHQNQVLTQRTVINSLDDLIRGLRIGQDFANELELTPHQLKRIKELRALAKKQIARAQQKVNSEKDQIEADSWEEIKKLMNPRQRKILENATEK